jgi:hypothetical protein
VDEHNFPPGFDILGKGFDGYGRLDVSAVEEKQPLFEVSRPSDRNWTNPADGRVYQLPQNVQELAIGQGKGQAEVFTSRREFSEFLSVQASVKGSYLAFSAEFSAAYSSLTTGEQEYQLGLYHTNINSYGLELSSPTTKNLSSAVLDDPDFKNLPEMFTPDNQHLFFRFFAKYGTHFVRGVTMGGRLFYYVSIEKSHAKSKQEVHAALSAEYNALFSIKAEAKAEWNKVDETWSTHRKANMEIIGGDLTAIKAAIKQPEKGDNFYDEYNKWIDSISKNPAGMGFSLMGVDKLFSGSKADAIQQAMKAYNLNLLSLESSGAQSGEIVLKGKRIAAYDNSGAPHKPGGFYSYAVLDVSTLKVLKSGHGQAEYHEYPNKMYDFKILEEALQEYEGTDAIIAMLVTDIQHRAKRSLYSFLHSIGAGEQLRRWENEYPYREEAFGYAIVGSSGWPHGDAPEKWTRQLSYSGRPSGNILELEIFFRPVSLGRGNYYELT